MTSVQLIALTDRPNIEATLEAMTGEFVGDYPWYPVWRDQVTVEVVGGARVLYAVSDGSCVVGSLLVRRVSDSAYKANSMLIRPSLRGRGYGTATYRAFFCLLSEPVRVVLTQCKENNIIARKLLDRSGFTLIGRLRHLVENSNDNIVFARHIGAGLPITDTIELAHRVYTSAGIKEFGPLPGV